MLLGLKHPNLFLTLGKLSEISDELWYLSGDRSTNINWYVRRYLLTKAYILTELYMIQDKSNNYQETWEFLDRRIAELELAERVMSGTASFADFKPSEGGPSPSQFASSVVGGLSSIASIVSPQNLQMDDSFIRNL
jgi:hypothetical protein